MTIHSDDYLIGYGEGYEDGFKNARKWKDVDDIPKENIPILIKVKDSCGFYYHSGYYFVVECEMKDRWVPYFLSMLKRMEANGQQGHSEFVGVYSDGDGDFRPSFNIHTSDSIKLEVPIDKREIRFGTFYDAG